MKRAMGYDARPHGRHGELISGEQFICFKDGNYFGKVISGNATVLNGFKPNVPRSLGGPGLARQLHFHEFLVRLITVILEQGSTNTGSNLPRPGQPDQISDLAVAISMLTTKAGKASTLADVASTARQQKEACEDEVELLLTVPTVLHHVVNSWYWSRPGLVPDEKGKSWALDDDKFISPVFFEAVQQPCKSLAIWTYIASLLDQLDTTTESAYQHLILQALSNACHLEYGRVQDQLRRHVRTGTGSDYFQRLTPVDSTGYAVVEPTDPDELTRADPQLKYLMNLCLSRTSAKDAVDWVVKLCDLHDGFPEEAARLQEREFEALSAMINILSFHRDLAAVVTVPAVSAHKGHMFNSRYKAVNKKLEVVRKANELDISRYAFPVVKLKEQDMATSALGELDRYVATKAGKAVNPLYQDMVQDCLSGLQKRYLNEKAQQVASSSSGQQPGGSSTAGTSSLGAAEGTKGDKTKKKKRKTRPSPATDVHPPLDANVPEPAAAVPVLQVLNPAHRIQVSAATADVFLRLFDRSQIRGPIRWTDFQSAMVEIGFSIRPAMGSIYTFSPPGHMSNSQPITLHRPHRSRIEGHITFRFSLRLRRVYGWNEGTFEAPS
jgi:hypothetical protein